MRYLSISLNHLEFPLLMFYQFNSVQSLSHVRLSATPWIAARQASLSITNSRSSHRLRSIKSSDAIQPSHPLSSPSPPAPNPSQHQSLFQWVNSLEWGGQSTGVSALASFLPKKSQGWSPSKWLVGSPCSPRDSQESSPTPQFKSINSSVLSKSPKSLLLRKFYQIAHRLPGRTRTQALEALCPKSYHSLPKNVVHWTVSVPLGA